MKKVLAVIFGLLLSMSVFAAGVDALQMKDDAGMVVTLYPSLCSNPAVVSLIPGANEAIAPALIVPEAFYSAIVTDKKQIPACWALINGNAVVVTAEKDVYAIPTKYFRPVVSI